MFEKNSEFVSARQAIPITGIAGDSTISALQIPQVLIKKTNSTKEQIAFYIFTLLQITICSNGHSLFITVDS